jgi:hypothetical protein
LRPCLATASPPDVRATRKSALVVLLTCTLAAACASSRNEGTSTLASHSPFPTAADSPTPVPTPLCGEIDPSLVETSWNDCGSATFDFDATATRFRSAAEVSSGGLMMVGNAWTGTDPEWLVATMDSRGELTSDRVDLPGSPDWITPTSRGQIVGSWLDGGPATIARVREGRFDPDFGTLAFGSQPMPGYSHQLWGVVETATGEIDAVGMYGDGWGRELLERLHADGSVDDSFADEGFDRLAPPPSGPPPDDACGCWGRYGLFDVLVGSNGSAIAFGADVYPFVVDASGTNVRTLTHIPELVWLGLPARLDGDDGVRYWSRRAREDGTTWLDEVRIGADGEADPAFGTNGVRPFGVIPAMEWVADAFVLRNGDVIVFGITKADWETWQMEVVRLRPDGEVIARTFTAPEVVASDDIRSFDRLVAHDDEHAWLVFGGVGASLRVVNLKLP